jgi:CheY-specific phosphatase CheX
MTAVQIESRYADALVGSATEVFATMVQMEARTHRHVMPSAETIHDEIVAVLGFTGSQGGVFVLSARLAFARKAAASMLMADESEFEDPSAVADSFGELCNMVGGSFKNLWVADGHRMDLSVPSVAIGERVDVMTGNKIAASHGVVIGFDSGELRIDLRFNH